ncbi:hypothetical protein UJ101_02006 [Flavobacteriaceae bacterium UJ101]|nr:hypothetical protein UJ101_02006 [Flavobacteriaceae bacterium UJ101]
MKASKQLANRFREVILNGTWIANTNYKDQLSNINWEQANRKFQSLNTIVALTFHIHYYVKGILDVLEGGPLTIKDQYSFDIPPIKSQKDWKSLTNALWKDSEKLAELVESLTEENLKKTFVNEKYGHYQRNIEAMIEHSYYHLGQIVLIKKMIQ